MPASALTPVVFGDVYCTAIEGCQEIAEFGRVGEWTSALHHWCLAKPRTGRVHRAVLGASRSADAGARCLARALEEFERAIECYRIERYRKADSLAAVGFAEYERGDLLRQRGDLDAAETAYGRSSEHGYDPQAGLALLWLARRASDAALGAVRRLMGAATDPVSECRLLPAAVDVLVTTGAHDEARAAAARLDEVAASIGTDALYAFAALASGTGRARRRGRRRSASLPA